jgi:hypothetical protein
MAENLRSSVTDGGSATPDGASHLDLWPLLRFGGWGACAVIALAVAVAAGRTDTGTRRAVLAHASITGSQPEQALRAAGVEMLARAEAEREARRTAEAVRSLGAERERLWQRIATLERNLDDLTGSVKRQREAPAAVPDPAPPTIASPAWAVLPSVPHASAPAIVAMAPAASMPAAATAMAPPAAAASAAVAALPATVAVPPAAVAAAPTAARTDDTPRRVISSIETTPLKEPPSKEPAPKEPAPKEPVGPAGAAPAKPPPRPATLALIQSYAMAAATPEPESRAAHPATPASAAAAVPAPGPEFAIDLGAATTLNGIRALWDRTRARQPAQIGNLRPLVSVRDGTRPGSMELRLVAGPIANAVAAARLCAALVAAGTACQPAMFDGQRLAQR